MKVPRRARCFSPFDAVYSEVTRQINFYKDNLTNVVEKEWLSTLISEFQRESYSWDSAGNLGFFRNQMQQIDFKIIHLAVSAYVHISYDLPRVIAKNWPGESPFGDLTESRAFDIYQDLDDVFPDVVDEMKDRDDVVGLWSHGLRHDAFEPAVNAIKHQLGNLRSSAWKNAKRIHSPGEKKELVIEKILEAIEAAIKDTTGKKLLSVISLGPPKIPRIFSFLPISALSLGLTIGDFVLLTFFVLFVSLGILVLKYRYEMRMHRHAAELAEENLREAFNRLQTIRNFMPALGLEPEKVSSSNDYIFERSRYKSNALRSYASIHSDKLLEISRVFKDDLGALESQMMLETFKILRENKNLESSVSAGDQTVSFITSLGNRINDYVEQILTSPESFAEYREKNGRKD